MNHDDQLASDVAQIRKDVDSILHGNGRKGLWAISDAVFGAPGKDDNGLVGDVRDLKESRAKEANVREGGRRVLVVLGTIVTILSGLGASFGWRVLQALGDLATQLP